MKIDDVQVFVVMDFHYYDELRDKWIIVDWKTGENLMMTVSN